MIDELAIQDFLVEHPWSDNTKERYGRAVRLLMEDIYDIEHMSAPSLEKWLKKRKWGSATQWVNYSGIKNYLVWRYGSLHPALKLKIRRYDSGPQRCLELDQVIELLASFDTTTVMGIRNLAICATFLDTGLRVSEICRLEVNKIEFQKQTLRVIVKGGNVAGAVFSRLTADYINWWLSERKKFAKPDVSELFVGIGGRTPGKKMTRSGIQSLMRKWIARIPSINKLSPHDLRRTFATIATQRGAPERVIAEAGRWNSTEMVKKYTSSIRQKEFLRYSPVVAAMIDSK